MTRIKQALGGQVILLHCSSVCARISKSNGGGNVTPKLGRAEVKLKM